VLKGVSLLKKLSRIYPGWWMVIATGILGLLGTGFIDLGFSVIFKPLSAELGLSRTVTSIASGIQKAMGLILYSIGGMASDKYGPRRVILIGVITAGVGCIIMYFVNSLWSFLLVWGIIVGVGMCMGFTALMDRAIVNWFVRKSGLALI
jgi:sugar phosphate permease